jgi:hypothetical protein
MLLAEHVANYNVEAIFEKEVAPQMAVVAVVVAAAEVGAVADVLVQFVVPVVIVVCSLVDWSKASSFVSHLYVVVSWRWIRQSVTYWS